VTSIAGTVLGNVSLTVDGGTAVSKALVNGCATFTKIDIAALGSPNAGNHTLNATFAAQGNFDASLKPGTLHVKPGSDINQHQRSVDHLQCQRQRHGDGEFERGDSDGQCLSVGR